MPLGHLGQGVGGAGAHLPPQVLGLLAELLEAGVVGQGNGSHGDSFREPAVRIARPKGVTPASTLCTQFRWALPFPRTGGPLRTRVNGTAWVRQPAGSAEPAVEPVELLRKHVQHGLAREVTMALVWQQHQPRGPAVTLNGLVEPLRLDRERARVAVLGAVDEQDR